MPDEGTTRIVAYEDRFAGDFARLNREWLDRHGLYEPADDAHLYEPRRSILDAGGEIFIALEAQRVAGTCALVRMAPGVFELAKLAVDPTLRGKGLGRRLTLHAIARARALGAHTVALVSSTKLATALRLYESLGFAHKPLPAHQPYATADVYMELALATADAALKDTP